MIQVIENEFGLHLASIVDCEKHLGFLTSEEEPLQIAVHDFKTGQTIDSHSHNNIKKTTDRTVEAWLLLSGKMEITIADGEGFETRVIVGSNTIIIRFAGFHALEAKSEDCLMVEFRNGPYLGKEIEITPKKVKIKDT